MKRLSWTYFLRGKFGGEAGRLSQPDRCFFLTLPLRQAALGRENWGGENAAAAEWHAPEVRIEGVHLRNGGERRRNGRGQAQLSAPSTSEAPLKVGCEPPQPTTPPDNSAVVPARAFFSSRASMRKFQELGSFRAWFASTASHFQEMTASAPSRKPSEPPLTRRAEVRRPTSAWIGVRRGGS